MRRIEWLTLGLALATATAASPPEPATHPGAYRTLGELAVQHNGRVKPLDTVARQIVKHVYGRESIKLAGGQTIEPVRALIGWSARPEFWDEQDIILLGGYGNANYQDFKQMVLADTIQRHLRAIADRQGTSRIDRDRLLALAKGPAFAPGDLAAAARVATATPEEKATLERLATKLDRDYKWLSPADLETANVNADGHDHTLIEWWQHEVIEKKVQPQTRKGREPELSPFEKKAREVIERLMQYQAVRDLNPTGNPEMEIGLIPRPFHRDYLVFSGQVMEKLVSARKKGEPTPAFTPVEDDALRVLGEYMADIQDEDKATPGTDAEFDRKYADWLRLAAAWVPWRVVVKGDADELTKAGLDRAKLDAFRAAYQAVEQGERGGSGGVTPEKAAAVVATARDLGESVAQGWTPPPPGLFGRQWRALGLVSDNGYPTPLKVNLETQFNRNAPFWWAPAAYGLALVLLLISLGIAPGTPTAGIEKKLYYAGLLAFLGGVGLEVYGFLLRILISGWAPVTNMYETVIWVALVAAVLGLILELIYRKKFALIAGAGTGLLGTVLAAGFPSVMDPNIKALQPVLRDNFWLTIHVLTEVSSYAAFALAMMLGVIGTCYYLTATYRRDVGFGELLLPVVPGLPLAALGMLGYHATSNGLGPWWVATVPFALAAAILFMIGGMMALSPLASLLGEWIARVRFRDDVSLDAAAIAGGAADASAASATADGGGVATMARPTVAEIRARSAANRPKLDARARAMQATAAQIKPLANFIYRAMQVGVLLIAAGTILGGVWADYSWGRFWGWDPKEVWALITLLVYLVPLHGRFAGLINTFGLVAASVGCFLSVVMAWYGVNFVLGVGLHAYAFGEGGQREVTVVLTAVLAFVFAAGWRRARASRLPAVA